jgi:small conductance mechanosensitive channel
VLSAVPWTGTWAEGLIGPPLKILVIAVLGVVTRFLVHRLIDRIADGIATGTAGLNRLDQAHPTATAMIVAAPLLSARREQRARTTASVLKSLTTAVVASVVALMMLDVLAIPVAPLLASAGIVGVAVGFGAQSLVKDVISGLFMIVEDQYGVGDVVDLGSASGVVEAVGLRVSRLRDTDGTVWYVRNGEVLRVGNRSQGWARAVLDVGIAYGEDVVRAQALLLEIAASLYTDEAFADSVLDEPEVWGIEQVTADGVVIRLVVKTKPLQQWAVARELRARIKARFDAEGVHVAYPASTVWVAETPKAAAKTPASASPTDATRRPAPEPPAQG